MGTRELKKRNRSKLLFGGVDIKKYASPSYIRKLLNHRRELLEGLGPDDVVLDFEDPVVDDPINPGDVDVAVGDVQPLPESTGENPALAVLDQVGSLTNALEQSTGNQALEQGTNPPSPIDATLEQANDLTNSLEQSSGTNPPSAIDAALATVANLTNQLANEQPNDKLFVPSSSADAIPTSVGDAVESDIHPTDTNLTDQLANEQPNNQLDASTANLVEGDIHPTDAALNYISQLVGSFENPDEEQFSESKPDEEQFSESKPDEEPTRSISENPAIAALNLISDIVTELALQQPSAVPPVTGPVGPGPVGPVPLTSDTVGPTGPVPPTSSNVQVGDVQLTLTPVTGPVAAIQSTPSPTDEALDNILKFTQSLVSPLSTQTPPIIDTPPIIETPPTEPNTSSSFLPQFSASGMLSGLNSLLPDDEDMTRYEVEEYTTTLGSDEKQNERKTIYNSDGATSGQHTWRAQPPPAPANPSSKA
jgi:hypothetical protein